MAKLRITKGKESGSEFEVADQAVIGRIPEVDIQIADTKASRRHTRVVQTGGAYFCEDMESRNGTLVNGKKISRVKLRDGDVITIGKTELVFDGPAAKPSPADDKTAATETLSRPVASARRQQPEIAQRVVEKSFDPMQFQRPAGEETLWTLDLDGRPLPFKLAVYGGGVLVMLVIAGLSYVLTMLAIG